jgi:hypothetical protein
MADSTILDVTMPTSWARKPSRVSLFSGLWAGSRHPWEAAGYVLAGLFVIAALPVLFIAVDHTVAVHWSNAILDLVSLR